MELVGPLDQLVFPDVCAACGAKASAILDVQKVFVQKGEEQTYHVLAKARVPFCAKCAAEHTRERALQAAVPAYRRPPISDLILPAFWVGLGLFVASIALRVVGRGGVAVALTLDAVALGFLVVGVWTAIGAWKVPWYGRVPPQTNVTRAFDFTDNEAQLFEPERRRYYIRNEMFAERFVALNTDRQWDARGSQATRAKWLAIAVAIVIVGGGIVLAILFPEAP
jgi:hypothetical protein